MWNAVKELAIIIIGGAAMCVIAGVVMIEKVGKEIWRWMKRTNS